MQALSSPVATLKCQINYQGLNQGDGDWEGEGKGKKNTTVLGVKISV